MATTPPGTGSTPGATGISPAQASGNTGRGARYQPLVIILAAAAAGIATDRHWPLPLWAWWGVALAAWGAWLLLWRRKREVSAAAALLLAMAAAAGAWHHCRWSLVAADDLGHFARAENQPVCLEAIALRSPRPAPPPDKNPMRPMPLGDEVRLEIAPVAIRDDGQWRPAAGKTRLAVTGDLSGVRAGDRLQVFGQLGTVHRAQNPGEFDYADFLRGDGVRSEVRSQFGECVSVVESGVPWSFRRLLDTTRAHGNQLFDRWLDPRQAALADAVLLGQREQIEPEVTAAFLETGTIHVLSISGLHVGILAGAMMFLLLRLPIPRSWAAATVAVITVLYALLVDVQPPVVRSTILVVIACWSLYLGREPLGFNSLAAAALVVLAINPCDLFRVGAQLSFLCVAGLIWFAARTTSRETPADPLDELLRQNESWAVRTSRRFGCAARDLTLAGMMLWLLTLPLVMARFHLCTPVAMLLNPLVWLPIGFSLLTGFATLVFGTIAPPLGWLCGVLCNWSFWLLEQMVLAAREMPYGHQWVPGPADWWLWGFYGGLAVLAGLPALRPPRRWCVALLAVWISLGFGVAWLRRAPPKLDCTFLSMNHGCAVLVELPDGRTLLYDAGRMGAPTAAAKSIAAVLWSRGITHLDAVVLSHADIDHYNALPELLDKFSVGVVYVSPVMFEKRNYAMTMLKESIEAAGVPIAGIRAGDRLPGGDDCRIEVLHPPPRGGLGSENANSVVLRVEYLGQRILLPGDLEPPGLNDLLAEPPAPCAVLLAPHHGSRQTNAPGLAAWCNPRWVVISGSRRWDTRPIRAAYEAAGSEVLETIDAGAIHVRIDGAGATVDSYIPR